MPFKKESDTVTWVPPTETDIKDVEKEIWEQDFTQTGLDPTLNEQLKTKVDEAIQNIVPGHGWGIIAHSNSQVYSTIEAITSTSRGLVDIIVPVYNSIHIVKECIRSVVERTKWPYHIYIVDDASDYKTKRELEKLAKARPNLITILTNQTNRGFAASVNRGIKAGNGEYVVLLNSDVLVTPLWLTKMLMAHKADLRNQIVCPATNNTAVVEIPMSPGASYIQMNKVFEMFAIRRYPEIMPTGFCFLFPRSLVTKVGYFDPSYFNYGEESDLWMRAIHHVENGKYPRFRAVLADDTYVFHERGSSFSQLGNEATIGLRKEASSRFHEIWPSFSTWRKSYNVKKTLGHLRDPIPINLISGEYRYSVCWVVHSTALCGGMKYIADIVNRIIENGGDARVALIKRAPESSTSALSELRTAPVVFESYEDFLQNFEYKVFRSGVVVAATAELSGVVSTLANSNPKIKPVLHVQSYEPEMLNKETHKEALNHIIRAFTLIPNVISNSNWITSKLKEIGVKPFATILPGVDQDLFYPRGREKGDDRFTVMMPLYNENLPWRGFNRGVNLIQELERQSEASGLDLRILIYGTNRIPIYSSVAVCLGKVSQNRLADLLGKEVDVFVDPSILHSYGMPALEAVASGVPVVGWNNKGIKEYLNEKSAVILPPEASAEEVAQHIITLLPQHKVKTHIVNESSKCLPYNNRQNSVNEFIECLEKHLKLTITSRRIVMVVPHLRKHGGPTTMLSIANELAKDGHDVSVTTVYTDINPEVSAMTDLQIDIDAQNIPKCDVLITNSDNPMCDALSKLNQAKKKIMLKLSHNARFKQLEEQGLNCKWDAIITSTNWLKNICQNPGDWNYKPVVATRVGWWHYSHSIFENNPKLRTYSTGSESSPFTIATLIHQHTSKGTQDAIKALGSLFQKYNTAVQFIGIGEIPPHSFGINLPNFKYKYSPSRDEMAAVLSQADIWLGASLTEGLGRMGLEAMSSGLTCILSNTGAEYAEHDKNCLLFTPGNVKEMLDCLISVIEDKSLRTRLREEGFRTAKSYSNSANCIESIESVISGIFKE